MRRSFLFFFLLFVGIALSAQEKEPTEAVKLLRKSRALASNGKVDSAIIVAKQAKTLAIKADNANDIGLSSIYLGNFFYSKGSLDSAIEHYRNTATYPRVPNSNKVTGLMNLGIIYDLLGKIDSSILYYNRSIEFAEAHNLQKMKGSALLNFGSFYDDRGNNQTALEYYQRALEIIKEHGEQRPLNITKINIANVYKELGRNQDAIRMYEEILASPDQQLSKIVTSSCYLKMAEAYFGIDSLQQANQSINELFDILESFNDPQNEIDAYVLKGKIEKQRGNREVAEEYFLKGQEIAQKTNLNTRIAESGYELGLLYFEDGEYSKANNIASNAYELAQENQSFNNLAGLSYLLSNIQQGLGNLDKSIEFLEAHITYRDTLKKKNSEREVNKLLLEHKENEYELLKKEQELQDLKLQNQEEKLNRNRFLLVVASVSAVILLVLIFWLFRSRRKERRLNEMLAKNNKKIEEQNEMLRSLNTEKDRLMHVVAHDLRNPFNAIFGFIQLIEAEDNLNEDQKKNIEMINKSVRHGTDIIEELLSLEAEAPTQLNKENFDIANLIDDVILEFEDRAAKKSIQIKYDKTELPTISNDKGKVKRIAENLLSNAIKFSPMGASIDVGLSQKNGYVKLEVSDQGPGFSEQDKALLFKKFQKLSAKPTNGESSTGIGLAIVQDFLTLMDGKIEVESKKGKGANMIVYIPTEVEQS